MSNNRCYAKHLWDNLKYDNPIGESTHPNADNENEAWKKWCASKELEDYCRWEAFVNLRLTREFEKLIHSESFRVVSKKSNIQELK